ncbi:hypothetical protein NEOLEDRAFT_1152521 [Neolentinus lepideus HHB14362 ss-1]|uniref:Uncharacterized protein n=1 Tax=Neolentinus lepideus HHB14362 ss-1 TaxID=1314782 RepID=A0A165MPE2_9AGAM|nr:hypothetical protein NEOLEDRAFT_1152521 [Neolentinus lepideus HHB14362 ss-1]
MSYVYVEIDSVKWKYSFRDIPRPIVSCHMPIAQESHDSFDAINILPDPVNYVLFCRCKLENNSVELEAHRYGQELELVEMVKRNRLRTAAAGPADVQETRSLSLLFHGILQGLLNRMQPPCSSGTNNAGQFSDNAQMTRRKCSDCPQIQRNIDGFYGLCLP